MDKEDIVLGKWVAGIVVVSIGLVLLGLWGCPKQHVYSERMVGEAELARATYNRQTKVREAEAIKESAHLLAEAEVERARGVAEANRIIGHSLKDNEAYLRWLYIEGLKEHKGEQIIYIPTEAGLPILEAGKRLGQ